MESYNYNLNSIQIKTSKTNLPVPVIKSIHLHSIYNPEKEALGLASSNDETLKKNKNILIFGLGFGYHVSALEKELYEYHQNKYQIYVIEPNREIIHQWKKLKPTSFSSHTIVAGHRTIKEFYQDVELVDFMSNGPAVIAHPASFQLNASFFKEFMSYHYPKDIHNSSFFIESLAFKEFLKKENNTTDNIFKQIRRKKELNKYDFLTLALDEIIHPNENISTY